MPIINKINAGSGYNNIYGLSKSQPRSNIYSIQKNKVTDTFSKGMTEKDIRYSFTFSQIKLNPKISINSNVIEPKKELLLESKPPKKLNEPQPEKRSEKMADQMEGIYNFIGANTKDKILSNNNNKMKKGETYPQFQNTPKNATKEYKTSQNYHNSRPTLDTFA